MSKIEVDAITEQSGSTLTTGGGAGKTVVVDATTVTLGRCGGTVALASGASQTGFGRTGTVDWQTTPKTATFTAVSGEGYFANTTGSAFNMNLPAGVAGAIVSVADYAATFQTNNLTVVPNGTDKIGGQNQNAILSTEGQSVTFVFVDSTQGWINTMDSTSNVRGSDFITASGGTETTSGDCKIHTFTGPGTFTVNSISSCAANNQVSYLVVAGGGGAGYNRGGGGGGAGFREDKSPLTPYTASPLEGAGAISVTVTGFPIAVGGGGAAAPSGDNTGAASSGAVSTFSSITAAGGGGGGSRCKVQGLNGGSGGGAGSSGPAGGPSAAGSGNTPPVSPAQGTNGGAGGRGSALSAAMGGGGATFQGSPQNIPVSPISSPLGQNRGANIPGGDGSLGGDGGQGATTNISGSPVGYAGGGGGGGSCNPTVWTPSPNNAFGGTGGIFGNPATGTTPLFGGGNGGTGSCAPGVAGTANRGGGAGGGTGGGGIGGGGGSGIVIIRYKFK